MNKIEKLLIDIGLNPVYKGFKYWVKGIEYKKNIDKSKIYNIMDLYRAIGSMFNLEDTKKTINNIERCMRVSILDNKENIQKTFNYKGKITNKVFLELILNNIEEV